MTRILIVKTSSMGDVVHNLPVIADIRREQPAFVVDWLVEEAYVDLVGMARGISRVIPVALRRWRKSPGDAGVHDERRAFQARLREERYDVVLDTQGLIKSALLGQRARLTAKGIRAGFSFGLAREGLARLFYDRGYAVDRKLHAIERMRGLAAQALGYAGRDLGLPRFELDVPVATFDWMPRARRYAVLLHATARAEKAWPAERWVELIARFRAEGIVPVLPSGSAAERAAAEALAGEALRASRTTETAPVVAPPLDLKQVAALLGDAVAVVGVDTGLLHLAAALDVPQVGLFGATPRWRYAPYWSPRAISLGNFGELGAQPAVGDVVGALRGLGILAGDPPVPGG